MLGVAMALLLGACSQTPTLSVRNPYICLERASSGKVPVGFELRMEAAGHCRRSRVLVHPYLLCLDSSMFYLDSMALDAPLYVKKNERRLVLDGLYEDPYAGNILYLADQDKDSLAYRDTVDASGISQVSKLLVALWAEACGKISPIDTLEIGTLPHLPSLLSIPGSLRWIWAEGRGTHAGKTRSGMGVARLQFALNLSLIQPQLGDNRREIDSMLQTLGKIVQDTLASLTQLQIYGLASADGPYHFNMELAEDRAIAARDLLVRELGLNPRQASVIQAFSRPEGWWPVFYDMKYAGDPDSSLLKAIIEGSDNFSDDDPYEGKIRALPCWDRIAKDYLHKDRKVEYFYSYTYKTFAGRQELEEMYRQRPETFSEAELYALAGFQTDTATLQEIYVYLLERYPLSRAAVNNLAVLYACQGQFDRALELLEGFPFPDKVMLHTRATVYVAQNRYSQAISLLQADSLQAQDASRYNLGLVRLLTHNYDSAYLLLRPWEDINSAVAAMGVDKDEEALAILGKLSDTTARASYVRAMVYARLGIVDSMSRYLTRASQEQEYWRKRASMEYEFHPYGTDSVVTLKKMLEDEK